MSDLIRITIVGPNYRCSVLAQSYVLSYDEEANQCSIEMDSGDEQYTFAAEYDVANQYHVTVTHSSSHTDHFTIGSVHSPEASE